MGDCFQFHKCCGCIDLKAGCFIIAYIELIAEVLYSSSLLIGLVQGTLYDRALISLESQFSEEYVELNYEFIVTIVFMVAVVVFVLLLTSLAFTITLIIGLHTNKRTPIKVYLVFAWIFFILELISFFCLFANPPASYVFIIYAFSLAIFVYFTLVIRSYHEMLSGRPIGPPPSYKA